MPFLVSTKLHSIWTFIIHHFIGLFHIGLLPLIQCFNIYIADSFKRQDNFDHSLSILAHAHTQMQEGNFHIFSIFPPEGWRVILFC